MFYNVRKRRAAVVYCISRPHSLAMMRVTTTTNSFASRRHYCVPDELYVRTLHVAAAYSYCTAGTDVALRSLLRDLRAVPAARSAPAAAAGRGA